MLPSSLLLSLQSADELRFIADFQSIERLAFPWLDLKNPKAGSLGCPDRKSVEDFLAAAEAEIDRQSCQLSLALGELAEEAWSYVLPWMERFDFAKVALSNCAARSDWFDRLQPLTDNLSSQRLILVHYADFQRADSPTWSATLEAAVSLGSRFILIDTFDKSAGRLWDWYSPTKIQELAIESNNQGIELSIAGSLRIDELTDARRLGASVIGVRSAVCQDSSRVQSLCRDRIEIISRLFAIRETTPS